MTISEMENAIRNLTERMNRIEAMIAHMKPVLAPNPDPTIKVVEDAVEALERATAELNACLPIEGFPDLDLRYS